MTGIRPVSFGDRTGDHTINRTSNLDRQEPRLLVSTTGNSATKTKIRGGMMRLFVNFEFSCLCGGMLKSVVGGQWAVCRRSLVRVQWSVGSVVAVY